VYRFLHYVFVNEESYFCLSIYCAYLHISTIALIKYIVLFLSLFLSLSLDAQSNQFYEFPSAFSPNGDSKNDSLGLVSGSIATLKTISIYNRWGDVLFDNVRDAKTYWDGTYLGKEQPAGTYLMRIKVKLPNGDIKEETRMISLIR